MQLYRQAYSEGVRDVILLWERYKIEGLTKEQAYDRLDVFLLAATAKLNGFSAEDSKSILELLSPDGD